MLEIQPAALVAAARFVTIAKRPDRADGAKAASRYAHIAAGEGQFSIRRADDLFYLTSTFSAVGSVDIPETAFPSEEVIEVMGQVGRTAQRAGPSGEPVRLAAADGGAIRLSCSALDTGLAPEPFVSRFPALTTADDEETCGLLDLADALRHLSRGHPPDRKRDENTHICTLFPDGLAMAFHRGVTVVTTGPALANPVSLRRADARRLAAWLGALRRAEPEVAEVEVARAEVCGQAYWRVGAVGAAHAVFVPAADRPFPRGLWDRARATDPVLRVVIARERLIGAAKFLATRTPQGVATCTLNPTAGGSNTWEMTVAGGGRGSHTARVPLAGAPNWAGATDRPSFSMPTRVLYEGVRLLRCVNVLVELRPAHRRLTLSAHTPPWVQSETEPDRSDLMVDLDPAAPVLPATPSMSAGTGSSGAETDPLDTGHVAALQADGSAGAEPAGLAAPDEGGLSATAEGRPKQS